MSSFLINVRNVYGANLIKTPANSYWLVGINLLLVYIQKRLAARQAFNPIF